MTLTDSNKLSTKLLHKLKVKLSLWLTNPSQLTRRTTRENSRGTQLTTTQRLKKDTVKHHSTQEVFRYKTTVDYHKKKKQTSSISNHKILMYKPTYALPNKSTDQQCIHNSNWSMNSYSLAQQCMYNSINACSTPTHKLNNAWTQFTHICKSPNNFHPN